MEAIGELLPLAIMAAETMVGLVVVGTVAAWRITKRVRKNAYGPGCGIK